MKRAVLDQVAIDYNLSEPAIALALDLTGARPDERAWNDFGVRLLRATGIAALGAGIIFFVAANWQDYGVLGRFAILELALVACVGLAMWKPPPTPVGQAAMVLATLVTGALLALFGQTYQTGADVYELFFTWAVLALPFALAGRSGAVWATWWVVLDVGLALYCGWIGNEHFMWLLLGRWGLERPLAMLLPAIVNLAGAALFLYLARTRFADHAPRWLARLLGTIGFLFGTVACIAAMSRNFLGNGSLSTQNLVVVVAFIVVAALIAAATLKRRDDVYPMALVAASAIAISTAFIIVTFDFKDLGLFFMVPAWLIASSTAAGFQLMRWVREWRVAEEIG